MRHAGHCAALHGAWARPHHQHVVVPWTSAGCVPEVGVQRGESGAQYAHGRTFASIFSAPHPQIHVSVVMPGLVATDFATHARGSTGPVPPPGPIGSPMKPQTAQEVAVVVADVIDRPVAEVYTNPASAALATRYFEDVARFEREGQSRST